MTTGKKIVWISAAVLIGAAAIFWFSHRGGGKKNEAVTRSATVTQGPIEDVVQATGEVSPLDRVEIKPPIGGRIEKLLVDEGARVKEGEILAWMSSSDRAAVLDAAAAQGPAEVKRWQDAYKPTPVVAPLSGEIIARNVVVGQTVDVATVLGLFEK